MEDTGRESRLPYGYVQHAVKGKKMFSGPVVRIPGQAGQVNMSYVGGVGSEGPGPVFTWAINGAAGTN